MTDQNALRARFEAWASGYQTDIRKAISPEGNIYYTNPILQSGWLAWQSATAEAVQALQSTGDDARDAERYRFLRDAGWIDAAIAKNFGNHITDTGDLERAIDAAITGAQGHGQ